MHLEGKELYNTIGIFSLLKKKSGAEQPKTGDKSFQAVPTTCGSVVLRTFIIA